MRHPVVSSVLVAALALAAYVFASADAIVLLFLATFCIAATWATRRRWRDWLNVASDHRVADGA